MFSKICILIWFGKVYVCGTSAELSGLPNTKNGSTFHCPSFETVRLHWQDFHPFTHYNSSSKSLEGDLSRYMNTALNACCPRLRIYDEKINITSSCEMEILIRRNHDKNPVIHFPIFSNKGETEQLQRRFVALFHSPGPAVLKFGHGSDPFSNRFLYLLKNVWALVLISFLHALLAGIIIWALVRTLKQTRNLLFMVSSRRFFSLFIRFNSKFCLVYFSFLFCRSNTPNGKLMEWYNSYQKMRKVMTIVITFSLFPLTLLLTFPVYISTYCK